MKLSILQGATSVTVNIFIQDSSSTTGAGLTGLVFNSASLTCYYMRPKVAATSVTLATLAAVTSAYSSGGFKEIDSTNAPGWYRFDIPDAAIANAERFVSFHFKGATNMAPLPLEVELTGWNNQDGVRAGLTALPNAAAEAAGGLYTRGSGAGQINQPANGMADMNVVRNAGTAITAASGRQEVNVSHWRGTAAPAEDTAGYPKVTIKDGTGAGEIDTNAGAIVAVTTVTTTTNLTNAPPDSSGVTTLLSRLSAARAAMLDALSLRTATAQAGAAGTITLDASASATNDLYKGQWVVITSGTGAGQSRLISGYVGATKVATIHRNWATNPDNTSVFYLLSAADIQGLVLADTLTTYTGDTPQTGDAYAVVNSGTFGNSALKTLIDAIDDFVDTEVAAIKAKTDNLPSDPADASDIAASFATVNTKLDTIDDFIDTEVAAIKAKTDSLTFTVAGSLDANIQHVNDVELQGDGTAGTPWEPL